MIEVDNQIRMIIVNLNDKLEAITHECSGNEAYAGYIDEKLKSIEWDVKVLRHRIDTAMNKDKGEKMNNTARDMFEELGYSKTIFPNGTIQYEKVKKEKTSRVRFYLEDKVYSAYYTDLSENGVEIRQMTRLINAKLYKAINKQIEELGWNK